MNGIPARNTRTDIPACAALSSVFGNEWKEESRYVLSCDVLYSCRCRSNHHREDQVDTEDDTVTDFYPHAAKVIGKGQTAHQKISADDSFSHRRKKNPFYPFSCFIEWEMAHWLCKAGLTQRLTNEFFKLAYVS